MGIQPSWATLNPAAIGPHLEIQESGLVVTANAAGLGADVKVRGSIPKNSGIWMFEVAYYGIDAFATLVSLGICDGSSLLSTGTGSDANSYGYRAADGGIYKNGALLLACQASAAKSYIGVVVDFVLLKLRIYNNGGLIATQSITGGIPYWPCFSVGSVTAYGISLFVNFGQRAFAYPLPGVIGWYNVVQPPPPIYLGPVGDEAFSTATTDTPANTNYLPALLNTDDFFIEKTCSVYLWKDKSTSATYAEIDVDDTFGQFGGLLTYDYRDCPIYVRQLTTWYDTLANASHTVATAIFDRAERIGENTIRIYIKDVLASDERAFQRRIFPPFADKGVAGRPVPFIAGAARSVDVGAFLEDSFSRTFRLNDAQITNIGVLRDRGNPLDRNAIPPQFVPTNDRQGVVPQTMPVGKFTGDVSSQGAQNTYPGAADVLLGTGSNWDTAWTASTPPPPGWTLTNTDSPTYTSVTAKQGSAQGYPHTMFYMSSNRPVSAIGSAREFSLRTPTAIMRVGKTYRISVTMWDYQNGGGNAGGGLCVLATKVGSTTDQRWISQYQVPLIGGFHADLPFQFIYKVPAGGDRQLAFSVAGIAGQTCICVFYKIVVEELAESIGDVPLVGIGFRGYMQKVLTDHGGIDPSEWSGADCDVLDAAYPGAPLGVQISDTATLRSAYELPMDSVCGAVQSDRLGVRRFRRLLDPATATPLATYDETSIDYPIAVSIDYAQGLTQTIGCQRNWSIHGDSDLVTDEFLVPPAFRTQLKRASRIIQVCNLQLRNAFQFAQMAGALDTVFDNPAIALAECIRVNKPFAFNRPGFLPAPRFVLFTINYSGIPPEYLFGDVIAINYTSPIGSRRVFFLQMNLAVVSTRLMPGKQKLQLLGWG